MRISDWSSDVCSSDLWSRRRYRRAGCIAARDPQTTNASNRRSGSARRGSPADSAADRGEGGAQHDLARYRPARKSVGSGKSVAVRVAHGGCRSIKKKKNDTTTHTDSYQIQQHE